MSVGGATMIIGGDPPSSFTNPFDGNTNGLVRSLPDYDKASGEMLGSCDEPRSSEIGGRSNTCVVTSDVARDSPGRDNCDLGEGEGEEWGGLPGETGPTGVKTIGFSCRVSYIEIWNNQLVLGLQFDSILYGCKFLLHRNKKTSSKHGEDKTQNKRHTATSV